MGGTVACWHTLVRLGVGFFFLANHECSHAWHGGHSGTLGTHLNSLGGSTMSRHTALHNVSSSRASYQMFTVAASVVMFA